VYAQAGTTSRGTEFWTAWMDHIGGADGDISQMTLYITADAATTGTVSFTDGTPSLLFSVIPNEVTFVNIPSTQLLSAAGRFNKGIHITSLKPIGVYAHIYASNVSGATLLLPVNTLGKSYYSLNYTQVSNSGRKTPAYSAFDVVATEDATTIQITPSAALLDGKPANQLFTITLNKGQVYQGLSSADLTGTKIQSVSTNNNTCKKIAVFSGSSKIGIGCIDSTVPQDNNKLTSDNLFQQVYPISTWGKNYITVSLKDRNYDIYRIVLSDPSTTVTINGHQVPSNLFQNGLYYNYTTAGNTSSTIAADKPIQVVQYTPSQDEDINCSITNERAGDPEMIYLTPIEQGIDHVTLYSTGYYNIIQSYINVVIPVTGIASFTLDGQPYTDFTPVTGNNAYAYAQIPVTSGPGSEPGSSGTISSGTHHIQAAVPFNAIAYGFGSAESYGYAAGTNLKNLNEFIALQNPQNNATTTAGCTGLTYNLQLTLPYQTSSITWDLKNGNPPVVDNSPTVKSTSNRDGQTLYIYEYAQPVTYTAAGNYTVIATVINPGSTECGSTEDVEFDFSVSDIPEAKFTGPASACPGAAVSFTDQTDTKGVSTQTWTWDFGDAANATTANPNTSAQQNPAHIYIHPGNYTVILTITNTNGCLSSYQQVIHINAIPKASFITSTPDCETQDITFTDTSVPGDGVITKWIWDFGDNTGPVSKSDNTPFIHQYAQKGTYIVSLTATSSTGCISDVFTKTITVSPLPAVDFVLPDVCLADAFAQFTSNVSINDNSPAPLTYSWDFGDAANATLGNPNTSTGVNPKHKYSAVGNYTVTLTVTSAQGCVASRSKIFTVNGSNPRAKFTVINSGALCSGNDVVFDVGQSTVDFGSITKIVFYYDYGNAPTESSVYYRSMGQIPADFQFHHNYGLFHTPASQTYAVKMEAYSGESCVDVTPVQNITVMANPLVTLSQIGTVCQNAPPIQITENKNGFSGTGVFSGPGVTASGLFIPSAAGLGTFTINYVFTAANGCDYSTSQQVTVNPEPTVNTGSDVTILEGGSVTIHATASGTQPLSYKWTMADGSPATSLDHDDVITPVASPVDDATYTLMVTSGNGCITTGNVNVKVLKAPVVPNTFTPNNDGINDKWAIKYLESYPNCTVDIYNRYGELLYSSVGYATEWDGTYKGAQLPSGSYYYIINPKNGRQKIAGSVTIIR
jgi:gliding motility-associated-like protein